MISNKLSTLLKEKKITILELSEKISMSYNGLRKAMKNDDFKVSVLQEIADVLDVNILDFFSENIDGQYFYFIKRSIPEDTIKTTENPLYPMLLNFVLKEYNAFVSLHLFRDTVQMDKFKLDEIKIRYSKTGDKEKAKQSINRLNDDFLQYIFDSPIIIKFLDERVLTHSLVMKAIKEAFTYSTNINE